MTLKQIIFLFFILNIGCTNPLKDKTDTFVVPLDTMPVLYRTDSNAPPPPPPIIAYNLPCNFIFDTCGHIYFYQQRHIYNDDEVMAWDKPPKFINLQPKDIVQISTNQVDDFFRLNILSLDKLSRQVAIASTQDTIKSPGLSIIIKALKLNHVPWKFRKTTQEETIVLEYKKTQAIYFSEDIKWDSNRIRFK